MRNCLALALICLLFSPSVYSQGKSIAAPATQKSLDPTQHPVAPKTWDREPTSFIGITLGAPLSASAAECPKEMMLGALRYAFPYHLGTPMCWENEKSGPYFTIRNAPVAGWFTGMIEHGQVEELSIEQSASEAETFLSALTTKYGTPTDVNDVTLRNANGEHFVSHTATWEGPRVTIYFRSIGERIDRCAVTVWTARRVAEMDASRPKASDLAKHF